VSAADLVSVTVSNDDAGLLTIALRFGNRTALTPDDGWRSTAASSEA
jgi:hypothetical protein